MLENSFWREGIIFCFRMSQYMLESMFPSMNRCSPVPAVVMQPQTMMLPPRLTVGKAQFSWYSSTGHRHTCWTPSESNKFTLDPSNRRTWFQSFMLLARLSSVNCLQAILWASFRRGFLLGRWPCTPTCCSVWRMVWELTSWTYTSATSKAMLAALIRLFFLSQLLHLTHSTRTQHHWSTLVRPVPSETILKNLCTTLATVL